MYSFLRDVFVQDVVLERAGNCCSSLRPAFRRRPGTSAQMTAAGELMVIEVVTLARVNFVEEHFHVRERN